MSIAGAKKSRGRPPVDTEAVNVRMSKDMLNALDVLISKHPDPKPSRPEAIRKILADALNLGSLEQVPPNT